MLSIIELQSGRDWGLNYTCLCSHSATLAATSIPPSVHPSIHRPNKVFLFKVTSHYSSNPALKTRTNERTDGRTNGKDGKRRRRRRKGWSTSATKRRGDNQVSFTFAIPFPLPPFTHHFFPLARAQHSTAHAAAAAAAHANLATSAYRTVCATFLLFAPPCLFVFFKPPPARL